jgi:hypothetical protein
MMHATRLLCGTAACLGLLMVLAGCEATSADREMRMSKGYIYYLDGAGGGGITNWAGGLKAGLKEGGYEGAGEIFGWNTGFGVVADQDSPVTYKRGKAKEMVKKAAAYKQQHPDAPLTFIGLSAGTAVLAYALEEMPGDKPVEDAVMCGASISSTYDLTKALSNLNGNMFVFTSGKDEVLGFLVPMAGTADRMDGSVPAAGLRGFRMPRNASSETRKQYRKVVTIPWRPEFAKFGYMGGHTDVLSKEFVKAYIAPRLVDKVGKSPASIASRKGKVPNPEYERWKDYGVGSYTIVEGHQVHKGVKSPLQLKVTLKSKSRDRLLYEREFYISSKDHPDEVQSVIAERWVEPRHHPVTDPRAKIKQVPAKRFTIKGQTYTASGEHIDADGNYPDWGTQLTATAYSNKNLPGHLAAIQLESHFKGELFTFDVKMVDYKIVRD